jgi:hypothetical protein
LDFGDVLRAARQRWWLSAGGAVAGLLLHDLRQTDVVVILDTPPLLSFANAAVVGELSDGCLLTVRFGATSREQLATAAASLSRVGADVLGVVLNRVPRKAAVAGLQSATRRGGARQGPAHAREMTRSGAVRADDAPGNRHPVPLMDDVVPTPPPPLAHRHTSEGGAHGPARGRGRHGYGPHW